MTARARAASPHAKAVERIVDKTFGCGPAYDYDRAILTVAILRLVARVEREARESAVKACDEAAPPAHTYASENADVYLAWDAAREKCKAAIQALQKGARRK